MYVHVLKGPDAAGNSGSSSGFANPWSGVQRSSLQRLQTLSLVDCPATLQQLAEHQLQQAACLAATDSSRPGLDELQCLSLTAMGTVTDALPAVLVLHPHNSNNTTSRQHRQQQQLKIVEPQDSASPGPSSSSPAEVSSSWPLQHLTSLSIGRCGFSATASELAVLQQLPALNSLQLSDCTLKQLPLGVCGCAGLTALKLPGNLIMQLPTQVSNLQTLQVGVV